ncbi:hypothetical protein NL366_27680, partial [Klebsiella pneumoniae]|nr:hypothetical protein [Klebsiella pneumoniae]
FDFITQVSLCLFFDHSIAFLRGSDIPSVKKYTPCPNQSSFDWLDLNPLFIIDSMALDVVP